MSIESCMHATDLDLDGSWLRESLMSFQAWMRQALVKPQVWMRESLPPGLDEGSPHEHLGLDEGSPHDHASEKNERCAHGAMATAMTRELSHSVDRIAVD